MIESGVPDGRGRRPHGLPGATRSIRMSSSVEGSNRTAEFRRRYFVLAVLIATFGIYALFGWQAGSDALDSDTTSLLVGWEMMRNGQTLDRWVLATPKFLPVVLDGALFEIGGFPAVLARSVLSMALLAAAGAAFVYSIAGPWAAALAAGFLLLNGQMLILTMGGNSSILGAAFVAAALLAFHAGDAARNRLAGLGCLFAAGLARSELLVFLPIAVAAFAWQGWRNRSRAALLAAGGGIVLICLAVALDTVVPTRLMGYWTNSRDVSIDMAGDIASQVAVGKELGVEADYRLDHHRQLESSYFTNLEILIPRLLRPFPLFLLTALGGLGYLWNRRRWAAMLLAVMGGCPLLVGWLIYANGGGLYERFFLLSMVACVLASPFGYLAAWEWLNARPNRRWAAGGRALIAVIALGAVAVGLRDMYNQRRGYLRHVSFDLEVFREGIEPLRGVDLREKLVLVHGWHWGFANLVLETDPNKVLRDDDLASLGSTERFLCDCDYYLYRKGSELTDALLEIGPAPVELPCMELFWQSADGAYRFFRRKGGLPGRE